jgi:A/G-specific adenine glycosylase
MDKQTRTLRNSLLNWYGAAARDLPWRKRRDPYAIWVSEVMLQQTRVETVVGYYGRFLQRFPTPCALAEASEDAVMAAWSGLGYYRRARLLHAGVREVVERYGGEVPKDASARRALPGVGRYTAGAIGSIAFGLAEPIVDGNVTRVLCRLFGIDAAPEQPATQRRLWHEAERLVAGPQPGNLNQALMELGATLCTKANPRCADCPLHGHCVARAQGRVEELPRPRVKRPPREVALVALVATRKRRRKLELWLQRGGSTLFAGLWNLPMTEGSGRRQALALVAAGGLRGKLSARAVVELEHVLTHRRLRVQLWRLEDAHSAADGLRALGLAELGSVGVSRLTRKALAAAGLCPPTTTRKADTPSGSGKPQRLERSERT